jgi:hypothetical protein
MWNENRLYISLLYEVDCSVLPHGQYVMIHEVVFVWTRKPKEEFGYIESDKITEVTPTRQNCGQTQWKY